MLKRTNFGDRRISKLARIVTQYSTDIQKGERVSISGPANAEPLLLALYREVLRCGAHPSLFVDFPQKNEIFFQEASDHQIDYCPIEEIFIVENFDVSLKVLAETNLSRLQSVDPDLMARAQVARNPIRRLERDRVRWNICLFPTDAYAQRAAMSLMEFETFYYGACFADRDDPVSAWKEVKARQDAWVKNLEGTKQVRIQGPGTDLRMNIEGNRVCNSWGAVNMPCGEIYTSPVENSVEGIISFDFPAFYLGKEINGLTLKFKRGKVIEAVADKGQQVIETILSIDEGATRVGELGIGTNFNINRFTKNLLLDEKMGGTIHLALGDSYPETLGTNRSAIHFDILKDLNGQGEIEFDGVVIQKDGIFTEALMSTKNQSTE